jgi:dipeptidyl aminopeptidase/acylaminoacyl peptidase
MVQELQLDAHAAWKQRYRAPTTWTEVAAENPQRVLATSNRSGVSQLYAWEVPTNELRQLTIRPEGVASGGISPDGRWVYYLDDEQGNEIGHILRMPFEGGQPQDITPDLPPYAAFGLAESRAANLLCGTFADEEGFHVYVIGRSLEDALTTPRRLYTSTSYTGVPVLAHDGEIAVVSSTARTGTAQWTLLAIETASGEQIAELWDGGKSSHGVHMFSPLAGDMRVLATTDHSGVKRPLLWNPRTGVRTDLPLDHLTGDIVPCDWSPDGRRILLRHFNEAAHHLLLYDLITNTVTPLEHPGGSFWGATFRSDDEIWAHWTDATHPLALVALDAGTGHPKRTLMPADPLPPSRPWRSVTFPSSDGQRIQGWLGVPEGDGPFPTILATHGGPTVVAAEEFSPTSQAWLDHGFAFLTINYRGSTTFGQAFETQIYGDLGHWEVEDMAAAHSWLVAQGIAQPDQVLLTGLSYGGFLTLLALGTRPELWAGGMAGMAVADWTMSVKETSPTLRGLIQAWFGTTPAEKPALYVRSSPITYVERVVAPVLIIQGRNDTRTPARPIEMYEQRMRALGKEIEVHWFDAGHGSLVVEQQIEHQELMLRFAYCVLGY